MSKNITGDKNVFVNGDKNTIIQSPTFNVNPKIVNHVSPPADSVTEEQASKIQQLVNAVAKNSKESHAAVWAKFKNKFKITTYKALPASKYNEAVAFLNKWNGGSKASLKTTDTDTYRKGRYAAIHAKIKELGFKKINLIMFLNKKYAVTSLKELSLKNLDDVYNYVMSNKQPLLDI